MFPTFEIAPRAALAAPTDPFVIKSQSAVLLVASILSVLGGGWMVISFFVFPALRSFRHQLILGLALSDLIMAINFLLSSSMNIGGRWIGAPEQAGFCTFNGFMTQVFVIQTDYWVFIIAIYTYFVLTDQKRCSNWIQRAIITIMFLMYARLYFILWRAHRRLVSLARPNLAIPAVAPTLDSSTAMVPMALQSPPDILESSNGSPVLCSSIRSHTPSSGPYQHVSGSIRPSPAIQLLSNSRPSTKHVLCCRDSSTPLSMAPPRAPCPTSGVCSSQRGFLPPASSWELAVPEPGLARGRANGLQRGGPRLRVPGTNNWYLTRVMVRVA